MKIVMFTDSYWPRVNGVTVSVDSFSKALAKIGHEVVIICPAYPTTQAIESIGEASNQEEAVSNNLKIIRVASYPVMLSKEDRIAKFHKFLWIDKTLEGFRADIVHINTEFITAEIGFYYAYRNSLPVIYTFHTMWEDYIANYIPVVPPFILRWIARMVLKNFCRRATAIIAPSTQILDVMKRYQVKRTSWLLPTGIDPDVFNCPRDQVDSFRERLILKFPSLNGKRILLFAGRIGKEKNLGFFTKVLPAVLAQCPDTALLLVGNGPDMAFFKETFEQAGISAATVFAGYMERKDLALAYAMADLFVFPSRTETQGLVTIEAMLSGTPVVAIGEMGTITVMGGDNGGFMTKNDPDEFASKVIALLTDKTLYEAKSLEARAHAQAWTIETMTGRLLEIYEKTVASYKATHRD